MLLEDVLTLEQEREGRRLRGAVENSLWPCLRPNKAPHGDPNVWPSRLSALCLHSGILQLGPWALGLCSPSEKLTPAELPSGKQAEAAHQPGGLDTVEVVQLQRHGFPPPELSARAEPQTGRFHESCAVTLAVPGGGGGHSAWPRRRQTEEGACTDTGLGRPWEPRLPGTENLQTLNSLHAFASFSHQLPTL